MSESEQPNASDSGVEKYLESSSVRHRFPISLKKDTGVWFIQSKEAAILTVHDSTIHIAPNSGDSYSASGPIHVSLKNLTIESSTRDESEVRLIETSKKGYSKLLKITFWCKGVSRSRVLAAILRARAKKLWTTRRKPSFETDGYKHWELLEVKRASNTAVERIFRFVPGTVDIYVEDKENMEVTSLYSIADIHSVLYSAENEEATLIFIGERNYRVWRGLHVWIFLQAVQERARDKLSKDFTIERNKRNLIKKRRMEIDYGHLSGSKLESLESICCIRADRLRNRTTQKIKPVILQTGNDFFIEKSALNAEALRVYLPEDIIRVRIQNEDGDKENISETVSIELSNGKVKTYRSADANCLISALYFIRKERKVSRLDVRIGPTSGPIPDEEKRIDVDRETAFRNENELNAVSEQIPSLSHDVDTNIESVKSFIDQFIHSLRAGNRQSLATCYMKIRELHVALERFNHIVPLEKYSNSSGKALLGLFPLIEEINLRTKLMRPSSGLSSTDTNQEKSFEYNSMITALADPILHTLARSLNDATNFEMALRKSKVSRIALDFIVNDNAGVSLGAINVLLSLSDPPSAIYNEKKVNLKSLFEYFSSEGHPILDALSMHTEKFNFYCASEIIDIYFLWEARFKEYNIVMSEKLKEGFRNKWHDFYLLSRSKSPILSIKSTRLLERTCMNVETTVAKKNDPTSYYGRLRPKATIDNPRVAPLVRASGGFLWHFLFALNTKMAREFVSIAHEYGFKISDKLRKVQEKASCSVLNAITASDSRSVSLLERIIPNEIVVGCEEKLEINGSYYKYVDIAKCISYLQSDTYTPELIWDQRTRLLLFQSITKELNGVGQKCWFSRRSNAENSKFTTSKDVSNPVFWNDFHFSIDYAKVLQDEIPLGNYFFAKPMFYNTKIPNWTLRDPKEAFRKAFLAYTSAEENETKINTLTVMKLILFKYQKDVGKIASFIDTLMAFLFGSSIRKWQEKSLIIETLTTSSRDEDNMRSIVKGEVIDKISSFVGISCAAESNLLSYKASHSDTDLSLESMKMFSVMKNSDNSLDSDDILYSRIACRSILTLVFSIANFSTTDDTAMQWLRLLPETRFRQQLIQKPSFILLKLIEEQNFCYITQALLSSDELIYRTSLLILHRVVEHVNPNVLLASGLVLFILSRKSDDHMMTSSWLLQRCLFVKEDLLNDLLPVQMIDLLKRKGPKAFSSIFSSYARQPDLLWSQEERDHLTSILNQELKWFLKDRKNNFLARYRDFGQLWTRKISITYPGISNRLICGNLFADIIIENEFSDYRKIESPSLVADDALDLLLHERSVEEIVTLLNVILIMMKRFCSEVKTPKFITASRHQFVRMLSHHIKAYTGRESNLFECIYLLLILLNLVLQNKFAYTESKLGGRKANSESNLPQLSQSMLNEEDAEYHSEGSSAGGLMARENSESLIAEKLHNPKNKQSVGENEIHMIGLVINAMLKFHHSIMGLNTSMKNQNTHVSPSHRRSFFGASKFSSRRPRIKSMHNDPEKVSEAVRICLNLLNHSFESASRCHVLRLYGAVDSCLIVLWNLREPSNDYQENVKKENVADSCFKFLEFIGKEDCELLTKYASGKGILFSLLKICMVYFKNQGSRGLQRRNTGQLLRSKSIKTIKALDPVVLNYWIARSAAKILIRLNEINDMHISQNISRLLGDISVYLKTQNKEYSPFSSNLETEAADDFLKALDTDFSLPTLIWNRETRHELQQLCDRVRKDFMRNIENNSLVSPSGAPAIPIIFNISDFSYACHRREICVNRIFLRIYNKNMAWVHRNNTSFITMLLLELQNVSAVNEFGQVRIASDAEISQKAEIILEALCHSMRRQKDWMQPIFKIELIKILFNVLKVGIGSIKLKALEGIKLAARKDVVEKIYSRREILASIYNLTFGSIERQLREKCLSLIVHLSSISTTFCAQLIEMGILVFYLNVLSDCAPVKTQMRALAVEGVRILVENEIVGRNAKRKIIRMLPEKLFLVLCGIENGIKDRYKQEWKNLDPIAFFDSFSDEPDLLWNESMRQELAVSLSNTTKEILFELKKDYSFSFDREDKFKVDYSALQKNDIYRGIVISSALKKLQWSFPVPRSNFTSSLIENMFLMKNMDKVSECTWSILVSCFVVLYKEVSLSNLLRAKFEMLVYMAAFKFTCVESVSACLLCIFKMATLQAEQKKLEITEVFWCSIIYILETCKRSLPICMIALKACAAVCAVDTTKSITMLVDMKLATYFAKLLFSVQKQIHNARQSSNDSIESAYRFSLQDEYSKLLSYIVGLLSLCRPDLIPEFEKIIDSDLVETAIEECSMALTNGLTEISVDYEELFNIIDAGSYKSPNTIARDVVEDEELSQYITKILTDSSGLWKSKLMNHENRRSVFYISEL